MIRSYLFGGALLTALLFLPTAVEAQKKTVSGDKATPAEYLQLNQVKQVTGKIGSADGKSVTLVIEYPTLDAKQGGNNNNYRPQYNNNNNSANLMRQYQQAMMQKDPRKKQQQMQQVMRQMQQQQFKMPQGYGAGNNQPKIKMEAKEFELDTSDKLVIRWMNPPFKYDDKGQVVQMDKAKLAELKGNDSSVPGYAAKFEELESGQFVSMYLNPAAKGDGQGGVGNVARPQVKMIVILAPSNNPTAADPKKKN